MDQQAIQKNNKIPFDVGDIIRVFTKDPQDNKVHATPFEGIVISLRGQGENRTFTVRKIATSKIAVERTFPVNSPIIEKVNLVSKGRVRRAKLYYLRRKR